jgi:UDPglucose 6-dehydrogenase
MYKALDGADALVICTEWSIFRTPDFEKIKKALKSLVIFDGRNLYEVNEVKEHGFDYYSIGR